MSALSIQPPYPVFTDIDGQPLEGGYVWIGTANLDPQTNPINVYWDEALTLPAAQPIRTLAGYPVNNGTPTNFYAASDYSIRVMNKSGSTIYNAPKSGSPLSVTPPQFDNDTSLATTAFVQRALGSWRGAASITEAATLSVADVGLALTIETGGSVVLPLVSSCPAGSCFFISARTSTTVSRSGSDTIAVQLASVTSFQMRLGDWVLVVSRSGQWHVLAGSVLMAGSTAFSSSFANPGYRYLPTGELEQFGTTTFAGIGNFNSEVIGGVTVYTNYYNITYPTAFQSYTVEAQATIACGLFSSQGSMALRSASCNLSGTGSPLTGMTISVTAPTLGYAPTVHWRTRGV